MLAGEGEEGGCGSLTFKLEEDDEEEEGRDRRWRCCKGLCSLCGRLG